MLTRTELEYIAACVNDGERFGDCVRLADILRAINHVSLGHKIVLETNDMEFVVEEVSIE